MLQLVTGCKQRLSATRQHRGRIDALGRQLSLDFADRLVHLHAG